MTETIISMELPAGGHLAIRRNRIRPEGEERNLSRISLVSGIHGDNLRRIMDMRGIAPKDVQEYLGLGCVQSVYRWIDGVNMPTIDNLYALSELLQVPIDAIVRGNRAPIVPDIIVKLDYT